MRTIRHFLFCLAACALPLTGHAQYAAHDQDEIEALLVELDSAIANKMNYQSLRLFKADSLEDEAATCKPQLKVRKYKELYNVLNRYDGKRSLDILESFEESDDYKTRSDFRTWVHASLIDVYGTMGLYHKAYNIIHSTNAQALPQQERLAYYQACRDFYRKITIFISDEAMGQEEEHRMEAYLDSILALQPEGVSRRIVQAQKELSLGNTSQALDYAQSCLSKAKGPDAYMLYLTMAEIAKAQNNLDDFTYYLAKAALNDIKSGITDYIALPRLVNALYENGELERAYHYLMCALEDANFYPSRTLAIEVSNYFPLVNHAYDTQQSYMVKIERMKRNSIAISYALLALAICVTFYLGWRFNNTKLQKKRADELQKALDQASVADRVKTVFIQNMRHEIRTPLNSIMGFAQLMSNDLSDEERALYNSYIQQSNNQLLSTLDDIIDVSNMEVGTFNFIFEELDVDSICRKRMDKAREMLPSGVEFIYDPQPEGLILYSDRKRIAQVLDNLLSNACKNTMQGSITLSVTQVRQKIQFVVTDTGKGVPADKADVIFEHFEKLDHYSPGLGLGLYVGRLIARALGGDIKLDTRYKEGARFVFTVSNKRREEEPVSDMLAMQSR